MQNLKLISFLFIGSVFWSYNLFSQSSSDQSTTDYANFPAWIKMMDDPKTNYYEANKAYDEYANAYVQKPSNLNDFFDLVGIIERFWFGAVRLPQKTS